MNTEVFGDIGVGMKMGSREAADGQLPSGQNGVADGEL